MSPGSATSSRALSPMGLLRLLLALAVVVAHAGPPFGAAWLQLTGGPRAVQIFYVVSGFYMTLILREKYVGPGSYAAFAKSRALRLLPMFVVVLAATIATGFVLRAANGATIAPLAAWQHHGPGMPWAQWLAVQAANVAVFGQDVVSFAAIDPVSHALYWTADFHREPAPAWQLLWVPQAWTISLELMFYALAPLLVRRPVWVIAAGVVASLLLRVALMRGLHLYNDPWTYRFFPTELALFLTGALACRGYLALRARGWLPAPLCWLATAAVLVGVFTFDRLGAFVWQGRYALPGLLLIVAPLLPFVFHATRHSRVDRAIGELSYPVYLVHYLLVFAVAAVDVPWLTSHRGIVVLVGSLALAVVLWRCVGLPLEARRQRLAPEARGEALA